MFKELINLNIIRLLYINLMSKLEFEAIRFENLKILKKYFLQHCGLESNNEAIKVWANWVIVNRINNPQIDPFLPTEELESDNKTVSLLIEKGCQEDDAITFYNNFILQCQRWKHRLSYYSIGLHNLPCQTTESLTQQKTLCNEIKIIPDSADPDGNTLLIEYRGGYLSINLETLLKLKTAYRGDTNNYYFELWKLLSQYSLLDGLSYQWSLPPNCFKFLIERCGIKTELFASPLNHHMTNYFSLFPDNDVIFGSKGDFFKSTWDTFKDGGFYEANPPFIESVFIKSAQIIINYLIKAEKYGVNLSFMYIMPDWTDSFAYQRLTESRFFRRQIILGKSQHIYWEYRKNRHVIANFSSHVILLSSSETAFKQVWNQSIEKEFTNTMLFTNRSLH